MWVATAWARSPPQRAVVLGTFPQVPTPSCAAGNRQARLAASAPTSRATAEVAARAVGGCRKKRARGRPCAAAYGRGVAGPPGVSPEAGRVLQHQHAARARWLPQSRQRKTTEAVAAGAGPRDTAGPHQSNLSGKSIYELPGPACSAPANGKVSGAGSRAAFWSLQSSERSIVGACNMQGT
uniref:Uncharacterized protein n=1 Tax=Molossus molossus TaxID=27622 RepID=A0A7J8F9K0_MOLMO|nr:hypothetical protein HJG59_008555 [Molossus molossus]